MPLWLRLAKTNFKQQQKVFSFMATYQTYQQVGIKEDISDIITNISPTKTPFQTDIGNEKVTQPLFQWQEDSLRAVNGTTSAVVEGADATYITVNPTVMRSNYTQIFLEAVQVSATSDTVAVYGRAREMAYQMAKSAMQLKRDLENAYVGSAQSSAAGSASVARTLAGYQLQIDASTITRMGASTNLTETALLTVLQNVFTNGADPSRIQVTPANSLIVAAFSAASGRQRQIVTGQDDKTIVNVVNLYVSPFGEQKVIVNRFLKAVGSPTGSTAGNTIVYDPSMWTKATLRPWTRETLAKTGDSTKQMLVGEFSLKHKNFKASGIVVDNAASGF
jgi:hypothetical protein